MLSLLLTTHSYGNERKSKLVSAIQLVCPSKFPFEYMPYCLANSSMPYRYHNKKQIAIFKRKTTFSFLFCAKYCDFHANFVLLILASCLWSCKTQFNSCANKNCVHIRVLCIWSAIRESNNGRGVGGDTPQEQFA